MHFYSRTLTPKVLTSLSEAPPDSHFALLLALFMISFALIGVVLADIHAPAAALFYHSLPSLTRRAIYQYAVVGATGMYVCMYVCTNSRTSHRSMVCVARL